MLCIYNNIHTRYTNLIKLNLILKTLLFILINCLHIAFNVDFESFYFVIPLKMGFFSIDYENVLFFFLRVFKNCVKVVIINLKIHYNNDVLRMYDQIILYV